jgi:HK97 family phage major capsid protein
LEIKTVEELNGSVNKLINDIQVQNDRLEKGWTTKQAFEEMKVGFEKKLAEVYDEMARLKSPNLHAESQVPDGMKDFRGWLEKSREMGIAAISGGLQAPGQKVLTIADSTHAGVLAPYEYVNDIVKKITEYSPLRGLASVRQTTAYAVEIPAQTALGVATWVAESGEKTETTGLTYALTEIPTFEMKILYKATQKMLEDSRFSLEAEISDACSRGFGLLEGTSFYSGNGTTAPEGIITNTTVLADARNVLTDNTLAFDDFIGTQYQLASPYAKNASWLLHRSTLGTCVGLKSATTNTYLLVPNLQQGQPPLILGSPVYEWADFPAITSSTGLGTTPGDGGIVLAYGDFRAGYTIVDRVDIVIQRLIEKYAEFGMIGFLARKRVGGKVVLPEAIQLLKNITT